MSENMECAIERMVAMMQADPPHDDAGLRAWAGSRMPAVHTICQVCGIDENDVDTLDTLLNSAYAVLVGKPLPE